ncbi:MAG: F0F1 ATP synthase subunit delta [Prevotella sp.]|nr:F0F1 ATP synthase subunit delta [Prevotella sp.]MCD8289400.1 F0F1 ATP synthase subunit delta [Prevotella sp.]
MNTGVISVRYARALLGSVEKTGAMEQVYADMQLLAKNYLELPQLRKTVDNPMLPKAEKERILTLACGGKPCKETKDFIHQVLKQDREDTVQFMANSYITLYRKEKNIISSRLVTAVSVDKPTERKMRELIARHSDANVEFTTEVNPDIIGGFILEYDTYRMDASVRTQLQRILKELK